MIDDVKREKILNFNLMVNNKDNDIALFFLRSANWEEEKAAKLYLDNIASLNGTVPNRHHNHQINIPNISNNIPYIPNYMSNYSPNNIPNRPNNIPNRTNNNRNIGYIKECQFDLENDILSHAFSYIRRNMGFLNNNSECCNYFRGATIGLIKEPDKFMQLLKTKKGVIILYNSQIQDIVKQHLNNINRESYDKIKNTIFYPVINDSFEGENLIKQLSIEIFPCYLFCKYKNEKTFYVMDKIEGLLNLNDFMNILNSQEPSNINNNRNNINQNNSGLNINQIIDDYNQSDYDKDIMQIYSNEFNNYNNYNNNFPVPNDLSQINQCPPIIPNNNNLNNSNNSFKKDALPVSNNNNINNNNMQERKTNNNKVYVPDYRDYDLGDSFNYASLGNSNNFNNINMYGLNIRNNSNELNNNNCNYSNYGLNNSNNSMAQKNPLSESTLIRKDQDNKMKELEKMQEEKERKEKEEKEKKRKEEEKEKEIIKNEQEEKEIFSKLIPSEPDDNNPDKCIIIFRLPDGEKNIQRKFLKTNKISVLYDYIKSLGREIYSEDQYHSFSIIQTFPFKNFEDKLNNTLEEEGLFPNSVLQIRENN